MRNSGKQEKAKASKLVLASWVKPVVIAQEEWCSAACVHICCGGIPVDWKTAPEKAAEKPSVMAP
jgi:hypothetical protein